MSRRRTIHVTFVIDYLLNLPDHKLGGALTGDGRPLAAAEARALLADLKARGFEAVPACPQHDAKGYCPGHDLPDESEVMCG